MASATASPTTWRFARTAIRSSERRRGTLGMPFRNLEAASSALKYALWSLPLFLIIGRCRAAWPDRRLRTLARSKVRGRVTRVGECRLHGASSSCERGRSHPSATAPHPPCPSAPAGGGLRRVSRAFGYHGHRSGGRGGLAGLRGGPPGDV